jgi:hypothetical protein
LRRPIEAGFESSLAPQAPLVWKVDTFEEYQSPLRIEERSRIRAEISEGIEELFRSHGTARTGDDGVDLRNLAFEMAVRKFPGLKDDPCLLELLFLLYRIFRSGNEVFEYRLLVLRMAEDQLPGIVRKPYQRKRNNPVTLLLLLADVETVKRKIAPHECLDKTAIGELLKQDRFTKQWFGLTEKSLLNWLGDARNPSKNRYFRCWQDCELRNDLPQMIAAVNLEVRGVPNP